MGPYTEQFTKQSEEITNNIVKGVQTNNQFAVNALGTASW
jgi:hypothetical protein